MHAVFNYTVTGDNSSRSEIHPRVFSVGMIAVLCTCTAQTPSFVLGLTPAVCHFYLDLFASQMDEGTPPEPDGTFVDYQTTMVKFSKAIAITAQEMVSTSETLPLWMLFRRVSLPV